ncbi:MAG: hypothetical protein IPJ81_07115 [Chitinophagaceae bacterium]|nr:hypothetical protein [Chitinophagaceae bacterium]
MSKTAQSYLINTYIKEKYGRERDITTKQMAKGKQGEEDGITMLSKYKKKFLKKNDVRLNNEFLTGEPDIFEGESIYNADYITDIKLSWDIWTFLPNVISTLDKNYWWQLQGYFSLTNAHAGEIAYILLDTPENIIQNEKYKLLRQMNVISEESPEYIYASAALEINMIYPDIPLDEKILIFSVQRDDEAIERINPKVEKCREFLHDFEKMHKRFPYFDKVM